MSGAAYGDACCFDNGGGVSSCSDMTKAACLLAGGLPSFDGSTCATTVCVAKKDITVSETWTPAKTYNLLGQVYVKNGATLTIQAGTIIASTPTGNGSGSLAITRGSKLFVNGTVDNPVIMTSTADVDTWAGSPPNPDTGTWREAANEWGNLTILGRAFISDSCLPGNADSCDADNVSNMEGLVPDFVGDPDTQYGGGDDEDDSGSISYLSIRYGGRVIGLGDELNGLSLGGIGRETDIHHVEVMNNVDDGIEVWGGTVCLRYFNIWNVGDDSLDVDQGWRGRAQFGLLVQGYSLDDVQGSGVGDNLFETDGAEAADAQPVTTATIYNVTAIGQPEPFPGAPVGDHATAWRDNARVQYRNCIFMDVGHRLVSFDNTDGDNCLAPNGYGYNGTLTWAQTWDTPWNVTSLVNPCADPSVLYQAQEDGMLNEIKDSVFFRNTTAGAYTEADAQGVRDAANNNLTAVSSPIASIARAAAVMKGGVFQQRVTSLDPRATNDARNAVATAPESGCLVPADWRGGFPGNLNWAENWTAADAFGLLVGAPCPADVDLDGTVGFQDLLAVLSNWGNPGNTDFNIDGTTGFADLLVVLSEWGPC
jgi:hypothetical protein